MSKQGFLYLTAKKAECKLIESRGLANQMEQSDKTFSKQIA